MYKASIFNSLERYENCLMMYNSYSGCVGRIDDVDKENKIFSLDGEFTGQDNHLIDDLVRDGFLVSKDEDEINKGKLHFWDHIYNSTLGLVLLPTEQCNFRCSYCYEEFKHGKMPKDIQQGAINYLKKKHTTYSSLNVSWFGGEPLMAMDVIDEMSPKMIEVCHKQGKAYTAGVTTNGYYMTVDVLKRLLKHRVNTIQVTLDGPADCHNKSRHLANGEGSFDVIIENLRAIRDEVKGLTFSINIRTNISSDTLPKLPEYLKFLHDEFDDDPRFSFYFRPVGDWGGDRVKEINDKILPSLSSFYQPIIDSPYILNTDAYIEFLNAPLCASAKRNQFIVGSDGTIYKCTMLLDNKKNCLGRITADGKLDVRQDQLSKWIIRDMSDSSCKTCYNLPRCQGGTCPAVGHVITGDICGYEKRTIHYVLYLMMRDSIQNPGRSKVRIYK